MGHQFIILKMMVKKLITKDEKSAPKFNKYFASIGNKVAAKLRKVAMNASQEYEDKKTKHDS